MDTETKIGHHNKVAETLQSIEDLLAHFDGGQPPFNLRGYLMSVGYGVEAAYHFTDHLSTMRFLLTQAKRHGEKHLDLS